MKNETNTANEQTEIKGSYRTPDGKAQIDFGITYRNGFPEYTSTGHFDGSTGQCLDKILAAYPEDPKVKLFHVRWELHHLKNAEMFESLVRQEAVRHPFVNFYDQQAADFLARHGLKMRITLSDSKTPPWDNKGNHGHHYRVTISRHQKDGEYTYGWINFDFWGSTVDAELGEDPKMYDVLSCISGDAYTPETFEDFCAEYGYEEDSIKALQQFRRCDRFAKRLRAFFTTQELEDLSEIH
jgi:hypothetical protein